jgi:hypothetical protein
MSTTPEILPNEPLNAPRLPLSPDVLAERLARLKHDFPDLFTNEGRLNPAELQRLAGDGETERYEFRWHGKGDAKRRAFTPPRPPSTLMRPAASTPAGRVATSSSKVKTLKC